MVNYYNLYKKYRSKYLELKESGFHTGSYSHKDQYYKVFRTDEKKYISYYEKPYLSIDTAEFTTDFRKPDKTKIALVNTPILFDYFTNKYGSITVNQNSIFIRWDAVSRDFKGFYLDQNNQNLFLHRRSFAPFKKYDLESWWKYEYTMNGVIIFG